jgi:hypothetical protein
MNSISGPSGYEVDCMLPSRTSRLSDIRVYGYGNDNAVRSPAESGNFLFSTATRNTVRSKSRCAVRLRYVDLVVNIEVAVEVCCYFTVFTCSTVVEV